MERSNPRPIINQTNKQIIDSRHQDEEVQACPDMPRDPGTVKSATSAGGCGQISIGHSEINLETVPKGFYLVVLELNRKDNY